MSAAICMWFWCASLSDIDDVPTSTCPTEYGTSSVASRSRHAPPMSACDHMCQPNWPVRLASCAPPSAPTSACTLPSLAPSSAEPVIAEPPCST